jgi:alkylated DNA repair dioxygenase AlkB
MFGPVVVGVSVRSACVMRFQRRVGDERRVYEQQLAPRSLYVLGGAATDTEDSSVNPR